VIISSISVKPSRRLLALRIRDSSPLRVLATALRSGRSARDFLRLPEQAACRPWIFVPVHRQEPARS
jgi:hypothetical protein